MFRTLSAVLLAALTFAAQAAVDINKASQAELEGIKGVGPAMSGRILEERRKGDFKDWSDLIVRVKGIGDGNAQRFSAAGLTVGGSAYAAMPKDAAPTATKTKDDSKR